MTGMRIRVFAAMLCLVCSALSGHMCAEAIEEKAVEQEDSRKVYALYHGFRRTREHDGDLGSWKQFFSTESTLTGQKSVNYNPDLLDGSGRAQMASVNGGPIIGMQSELDEDYIEYEILLAKMSHIDGFLVDFGFPEYGNTVLLNAIMEQAGRYDFEIGVNWCDSWLVNKSWIQNYRPEIITREDRLEYFKTSLQYLLDEVYAQDNAAVVQGHPLIFMFGGGPTADEMKDILETGYRIPEGLGEPWYIRRITLFGQYSNGNVSYSDPEGVAQPWLDIGVDVHSWITPRLRLRDSTRPSFDKYATSDDVLAYNKTFSSLWKKGKKAHLNTAVVTPGFDNHACAGWGDGIFSGIDRENGVLYRNQWQFALQNKDLLDVIFIASWSDFTEGHEIEPTIAHGYTAVEITQEYAAQIKDLPWSEDEATYLRLPQRLFEARKKAKRFEELGVDLASCHVQLDEAAEKISSGSYSEAEKCLSEAEQVLSRLEQLLQTETIAVSVKNGNLSVFGNHDSVGNYHLSDGIGLVIDEDTAQYLRERVYNAVLEFYYIDDNYEKISVTADCNRSKPVPIGQTQGDFSVVAEITKNATGECYSASVPLYQKNVALTHQGQGNSDFWLSGDGVVRDFKIVFEVLSFPPERIREAFMILSVLEDEQSVEVELLPVSDPPSEFVIYGSLKQDDIVISTQCCTSEEIAEGAILYFQKNRIGANAVLNLFTWDSFDRLVPLDTVFKSEK